MKRYLLGVMISAVMMIPPMIAQTTQAQAVPRAHRIHNRKQRQQKRIAQGIRSGQLTPAETARLERKEKRLNRSIHNKRVANGGHLTAQQRRQVNRRQNQISKSIYREKHDKEQMPK